MRQQVERMRRQMDYHLAHARAAASGAAPGAHCSVLASAEGLARTLLRLHAGRGLAIDVAVESRARRPRPSARISTRCSATCSTTPASGPGRASRLRPPPSRLGHRHHGGRRWAGAGGVDAGRGAAARRARRRSGAGLRAWASRSSAIWPSCTADRSRWSPRPPAVSAPGFSCRADRTGRDKIGACRLTSK